MAKIFSYQESEVVTKENYDFQLENKNKIKLIYTPDAHLHSGNLREFNLAENTEIYSQKITFLADEIIKIDNKNFIKDLPKKINIYADVNLNIKIMFDNQLNIDGNLSLNTNHLNYSLEKTKEYLYLKNNIKVNKELNLDNANNRIILDGIKFNDLSLKHSLVEIPDNLKIDRLDLSYYKNPNLPNNLEVNRFILVGNETITDISKIKINSNLNLRSTNIQNLPENFKLKELYLADNPGLKKLPNDLEVDSLLLYDNNITDISKIKVNKILKVNKESITSLPANSGNYLNLEKMELINTKISNLDKIRVEKTMYLHNSDLLKIEDIICHELILSSSEIDCINNINIDKFTIVDSTVNKMPENLNIDKLELYKAKINHFPKKMTVNKIFSPDWNYKNLNEIEYYQEFKKLNVLDKIDLNY